MSYNSNVPTTGHSGSQDYVPMKENFSQIQTSFSVNHEPLASGGGTEGYHTLVNLAAALGSDPNLTAPITSLYTKLVSSVPQLFFQNGSSSTNVVQLTGGLQKASGNDGKSGTYRMFQLPWAMKMFVGTTAAFSGSRDFNLSGGQTFGATFYTSQATATSSRGIGVSMTITPNSNSFNIQTEATCPVNWFVLTN